MMAAVLWYSARGALLEERGDDDHPVLLRKRLEGVGGRPGNRLGEREEAMVLGLAEVGRPEELLRADDVGAFGRGLAGERELPGEIGLGIGTARHLGEADAHDAPAGTGAAARGRARASRSGRHVGGFVIACEGSRRRASHHERPPRRRHLRAVPALLRRAVGARRLGRGGRRRARRAGVGASHARATAPRTSASPPIT